jgi:hypothetical protein
MAADGRLPGQRSTRVCDPRVVASAAFVGMVAAFLLPSYAAGRTMFMRDTFAVIVPHWQAMANEVAAGRSLLWYPLVECGAPFLGDPFFGTFYPPNWLLAALPASESLPCWWAIHLLIAGASMFLLCRQWGLTPAAGLLAAVGFAFSTWVVAWLEFTGCLAAWAYCPCVIALADRAVAGGPFRADVRAALAAPLGICVALQIVTVAEWFYYSTLIVSVYAVWLACVTYRGRQTWHGLAVCGLGLALGLALAAPQVVVLPDIIRNSIRAQGMDPGIENASASPWHWLQFLAPFVFGTPGYPDRYWAPRVYEFALGTCYTGMLTVQLLAWAAPRRHDPAETRLDRARIVFAWAMLTFGLAMAAGKYFGLYPVLHSLLPGLGRFRFPTKFLAFAGLSIPLLAAVGFDRLTRSAAQRSWRANVMAATGIPVAMLLLCLPAAFSGDYARWLVACGDAVDGGQVRSAVLDLGRSAVLAVVNAAWIMAVLRLPDSRRLLVWAGPLLLFADLSEVGRHVHPLTTAGIYDREPSAVIAAVKGERGRAFSPATEIQLYLYGEPRAEIIRWAEDLGVGNRWEMYGIAQVRTAAVPKRRHAVVYQALWSQSALERERAANLLGVRAIVSPTIDPAAVLWGGATRSEHVTRHEPALPRFGLYSRWRVVASEAAAQEAVFSPAVDPLREVVIEADGSASITSAAATGDPADDSPGTVTLVSDSGSHVRLRAVSDKPCMLFVAEAWHRDWRATVNGRAAPVLRANVLFRAIPLDAGTSDVVLSFFPTSVGYGLCSSLVAAVVSLAIWLRAPRSTPPHADSHAT